MTWADLRAIKRANRERIYEPHRRGLGDPIRRAGDQGNVAGLITNRADWRHPRLSGSWRWSRFVRCEGLVRGASSAGRPLSGIAVFALVE